MDKINELQDKIQNLQTQINATQTQINDYKTNPKYYQTYSGQYNCGHFGCMQMGLSCGDYYTTTYFTKVREIANAESSLNSLQNQLKSTQDALDSLLQDKQAQIQATLTQANAKSIPTPPPPTQITSSINILQEINSLQNILSHDTKKHTSHTGHSKNA